MENYPKLTDEIVTTTYEEVIRNGLPFLQIFPQMFQDANIADIAKALGRSEVNISLLVARTGVWLKEFNELDKVLEPMPIPERRRFERLVARKWMRGEDMTLGSKTITLFQKLAGRFITRGQV